MKFIIPVLVGGIIGYITNWIAIKMLFRPHKEKRLFGYSLPFTPGLIPKEKDRIAKKVGEVVGEHLLSSGAIKNWLVSTDLEVHIRDRIEASMNKLKREDRSIKAFLNEEAEGIVDGVKEKLTAFICREIKKSSFRKAVVKFIKKKLLDKIIASFYGIMDEGLEKLFLDLTTSSRIESLLGEAIEGKLIRLTEDDRLLKEVVPEEIIFTAKEYIKANDEQIVNILKAILEEPEVERKVKTSITNIVSQQINKIVAFFISPEAISNTVYIKLKEYIGMPEVKENIIHGLIVLIDKLLENRVSTVVEKVKYKFGEEEIARLVQEVKRIISNEEITKKVVDILAETVRSQEAEIQKALLDIISMEIEKIVSSKNLYSNIYNIVDSLVGKLINKPISAIAIYFDNSFIDKIIALSKGLFDKFIENRLPTLLEFFNISKIVEEEINRYDVAFTEELILQIAHRELKAITWLGGLLGAILGLLTPILQRL